MGKSQAMLRKCAERTRVGCDGFHPKVTLDLTKETGGEVVEFLDKVEQSGTWPQQACTAIFFLIPKNVASVRPIALVPTWIRWWEAMRAPEMVRWQYKWLRRRHAAHSLLRHARGIIFGW